MWVLKIFGLIGLLNLWISCCEVFRKSFQIYSAFLPASFLAWKGYISLLLLFLYETENYLKSYTDYDTRFHMQYKESYLNRIPSQKGL